MIKRGNRHLFLTAVLILAASTGAAFAQIDLRFSPPDTTFGPGDTIRVSVMLDDAVYFRTIELTVTYDPTILGSVSGGPGSLLSDSGLLIWESFEESVPGQWHGVAIILGAADSLSGPGELFAWEVEGLLVDTTPVIALEANLYRPNATKFSGVNLDPTTIRVRVPASAVGDLPSVRHDLKIQPNPFNPGTRVSFDLPSELHANLSVFDARGRRVASLHDGRLPSGPVHFDWDGRDDTGLAQPGGVYFFRLESRLEGVTYSTTTKGLLLK